MWLIRATMKSKPASRCSPILKLNSSTSSGLEMRLACLAWPFSQAVPKVLSVRAQLTGVKWTEAKSMPSTAWLAR